LARVVIIGSGLAGASAAWHLAPRHDVWLFEHGDQPGAEASAQNAGMQRRLAHDPVERRLAIRSGEWLARDLHGFEQVRRPVGGVVGLVDRATSLDAAVEDLRSAGLTVDDISHRVADVAPGLEGAPLARAFSLPDESLLDAHALVGGFLAGARTHGAIVKTRAPVDGVEITGGHVVGVWSGDTLHRADVVVIAAGAWSGRIARELGLDRPLFPLARHLLFTDPHPTSAATHPWCWLDDAGIYARPEAGGWLCSPCDEALSEPARGPGSRGPVDPLHRAIAQDKLERLMPALADVRFAGGWTGLRTFAPDRRPLLGPDPQLPGLHWATALGGFGVTCAFAVGEAVATWIDGRDVPWLARREVDPGRVHELEAPSSFAGSVEMAR